MFNLLKNRSDKISPAFKSKDKTILCLTTLHHRRYVEDIINSIGLPIGSHIRLRYRKQYVCPILWKEITQKKVNSKKHILFALAGKTAAGTLEVAPIRKGKVVSASCQGDLAIVDIQLLDYVFSSSPTQDILQILSTKASNLPSSAVSNVSSPGIYLQSLTTPAIELQSNPSVLGWEKVAAAFFKIDTPRNNSEVCAPFLYHINKLEPNTESKLKKTGKLNISMGKQLKLEIHTIARPGTEAIRNPLGEVILDLSHTAADFISSRRVRADSSRDVKSIGIITTPLFSAADGHLSIRTNVFKNKPEKDQPTATVAAPVPSPVPVPAAAPPVPAAPAPPANSQDMLSADKRDEIAVARYDFPLRVGGYRPWLASGLIAGAAAVSVYKISNQCQFKLLDTVAPITVFILTFFGLSLGIIKK